MCAIFLTMEIKKENLEKSKVKLTIKISSPEMRGFFSRVYNKLAPQVEVKGFRPGTAPRSLTISAIGENRLNSEIINLALNETYAAALKKEKRLPVFQPKINIKMLKDLTADTAELEYEAEVDILPEVKVGDYKKIKVSDTAKEGKEEEIKVTNEEIEQVLSHLQRQKAQFKDINRPLKDGDRAEINFEGFERGVKIENLSSKNYPIILGSKVLIPDFEKNLIGLKKGDKKEFSLLIPVPGTGAGKKMVDFKVEVLQTQEVILPKLDDEFAKNFQKDNLNVLKEAVKKDIITQKKESEKKQLESQVLEGLLKITETEIPESLIEQEIDRQINDIRSRIAMTGMTFEKYLENIKKTPEEFRTQIKPQAEKTIKIGLALGEIVKRESANWRIDPKDKQAGKLVLEKLIEYATK